MKHQDLASRDGGATANTDTSEARQEYRVRVIGTGGAVLTEIDDLAWEAIWPYVREYSGRFARIENRPTAGRESPD